MKQKIGLVVAFALAVAGLLVGCGSAPTAVPEVPPTSSGPVVGTQEGWQTSLVDPVEVAGQIVNLQLGDKGWIASVDGTPVMGGTLVSTPDEDGIAGTLTLTQTHIYTEPVGWVEASTGEEIAFSYTTDPPVLTPQE
jgi:hypothetical protein